MTHEQLKADLPAYVMRRLEKDQMKHLDEHLESCAECREMAASWRDWAGTLREDGELFFAPHPEPGEVRLFAHGALEGDAAEQIRHHLEVCASCELEAAVWRSRPAGSALPAPSRPVSGRRMAGTAGLSAAAGLVIGLGLGWLLFDHVQIPAPWAGPTAQIVLPPMLRDSAQDQITHTIKADEKRVVVSFPAADAGFQNRDGSYRFEIAGPGGVVYAEEMTGAMAARHVETASVVTFDLPAGLMPPGRYQFRVTDGGGTVVYQTSVDIAGS